MGKMMKGFTIIELLVIISVIGVLTAIGAISFHSIQSQTRDSSRGAKIITISEALENYYSKNGEYPSCAAMSQSADVIATSVLPGIEPSALTTPSNNNDTNSFIASCNELPSSTDAFAYIGDGSETCLTGSSCTKYILEYWEESTNTVKTAISRHGATKFGTPAAPSIPVITVALNGSDVQATITPTTCTTGTVQYGIENRTNNGSWTNYTDWSDALIAAQVANGGVLYSYRARARCYIDDIHVSIATISTEATYVHPIATPAAPVISANTIGSTTSYSWTAPTCADGTTARYQYRYTIAPAGYDSGLIATAASPLNFTTSTEGQTYTVAVQSKCYNANTASNWSSSSSASYENISANTPIVASPTVAAISTTGATLGASITSIGSSPMIAYGICWGTNPSPTTNCSPAPYGTLAAMSTPTIAMGANAWPYDIIVSNDGTSVYAASDPSGAILMYSRDTSTGLLTALSPATVADGQNPRYIAISADGTSVYASNYGDGTVSMFSRDTNTGLLTALSPEKIMTTGESFAEPMGIAVSDDGTSVYVANYFSGSIPGAISMFRRDTNTGLLTALSPANMATTTYAEGLVISNDGTSVYVINSQIGVISMFKRDTNTGLLTALSPATIASESGVDIAISADGTSVYVTNYGTGTISMYSRNINTGLLTFLSPATVVADINAYHIKVSDDGVSVYTVNYMSNTISMYRRDTSTGLLTALNPITIASIEYPRGLAISADGTSVYAINFLSFSISLYRRLGASTGAFSESSTGMISNTLIYYRGYATNSAGTSYSADGTFYTAPDSPLPPIVAANNTGDATTYSWSTPSCQSSDSIRYQYQYTISPSGYNSGWLTIAASPVSFTTSTSGQTYAVEVQAQCYNTSASSAWSTSGSASYTKPAVVPTIASPTATTITSYGGTLGATIVSTGGATIISSGICWGTSSNPTTNCSADGPTSTVTFSRSIVGMPSNTLIYYRGYAANSTGTSYSANGTFTTKTVSNIAATIPTGYITYSGTAPTTTTVGNIDNGVATYDATYFVAGANSSGTAFYDITNTPSNLIGVASLNYNIRYKITPLAGDTEKLYIQIFKSDRTTALTDKMLIVSTTAAITETTKGVTPFTGLSTAATKADWDGAVMAITTAHSASGSKDGSIWSINEVEIGGTYYY